MIKNADAYVEFVRSRRDWMLEFGKHDCCITACDMIHLTTGIDPAVDFRGKYSSPREALKIIKEHGDVDGIAEKVCEQFGWPEIHPGLATRGDLVCLDVGGRKALGWIDLDASKVMCVGMVGFQLRPRSHAIRAWRIP